MTPLGHVFGGAGGYAPSGLTLMSSSQNNVTGNGEMIAPPEHVNLEELVGLSPRSTISDDYLAGASPQMSEDEDAAESIETPPDNMPESSHPSSLVWNFAPLPSSCMGFCPAQKCGNICHECIALKHAKPCVDQPDQPRCEQPGDAGAIWLVSSFSLSTMWSYCIPCV